MRTWEAAVLPSDYTREGIFDFSFRSAIATETNAFGKSAAGAPPLSTIQSLPGNHVVGICESGFYRRPAVAPAWSLPSDHAITPWPGDLGQRRCCSRKGSP